MRSGRGRVRDTINHLDTVLLSSSEAGAAVLELQVLKNRRITTKHIFSLSFSQIKKRLRERTGRPPSNAVMTQIIQPD